MRLSRNVILAAVFLVSTLLLTKRIGPTNAADHTDPPHSSQLIRQDANIVDFFAFVAGNNLVMALSTNGAIPKTAESYIFPSDVSFEISIDFDSPVSPQDPFGDGGMISNPNEIREDVIYRIKFREDGSAILRQISTKENGRPDGVGENDREGVVVPMVSFFAGLRDDPFIRSNRAGRNIAAIVLEVPLQSVLARQSTLLLWATANVEDFTGPFQDLAGRAFRSQFPEQVMLNSLHPKHHFAKVGLRPDILILDTARPSVYPNGRALVDDVVLRACELSGECRALGNDRPGPPYGASTNDVALLSGFPYFPEPHAPTPPGP